MSQKREANSCPDGYRVLSTSELRELLQDEAKMDKIVRLSEKVRVFLVWNFGCTGARALSLSPSVCLSVSLPISLYIFSTFIFSSRPDV